MSAPDRVRAYLELPSELIAASTPVEFRQLLDHIMTSAGLTASQIAIKTTIPRSQAYNMVATSRTTLPSKPGQVREFVEACGLAPVQVALVMDLWTKLDQQVRQQEPEAAVSSAGTEATSDIARTDTFVNIFSSPVSASAATFGVSQERHAYRGATYRPRAFIDLLFLVIEDEARTRRALRLLLPLTLATVAIVASFAIWAILQPSRAPMIGAILFGGFLAPLAAVMKSATRPRSRPRK